VQDLVWAFDNCRKKEEFVWVEHAESFEKQAEIRECDAAYGWSLRSWR